MALAIGGFRGMLARVGIGMNANSFKGVTNNVNNTSNDQVTPLLSNGLKIDTQLLQAENAKFFTRA